MSTTHISLAEFEELYPWESETQKKGFQALCKDIVDSGRAFSGEVNMEPHHRLELTLQKVCAWFIQKDHESNQWYNERIGDLDKKYLDELVRLTNENRALRGDVDEIKQQLAKANWRPGT